jgi:drug/metabolite transporter (DMT)-like permease
VSLALLRDRRLDPRIVAAFATIYLVWGSTFLAIRVGVRQFPPLQIAGMLVVVAGVALVTLPGKAA